MDLNQVKYFVHLADTLNFTVAARRSGVSQPSLTKAIRRLEEELGGPLIHRDGKDSRLTALGREMQVEFMRLDALVDGIRERAESSVSGRHRVLTFGVATTIAPAGFSRFIKHALSQLPDIDLHLQPMGPGEGTTEILSGKYDACVLPGPPAPNFKLVTVPLFREPLRLAMAADHVLARGAVVLPAQMMEEPYLDRLGCEFRTQVIEHFMDRDIVMRPRLQSEREDWVQHLVAAGLGVCTVPERSVIVGGLALRPVEGMDISREVTLVAVSGSGSPMEMRQIVKMAAAYDWSI
jgi:DNA-binding transcriptional LysR family regulator